MSADVQRLLESDLTDRATRLVLADALEDAGRMGESDLARSDYEHLIHHKGRLRPAMPTWAEVKICFINHGVVIWGRYRRVKGQWRITEWKIDSTYEGRTSYGTWYRTWQKKDRSYENLKALPDHAWVMKHAHRLYKYRPVCVG